MDILTPRLRSVACHMAAVGILAFSLAPAAQAATWVEQGPGSIINGQVEGMAAQNNPVHGAIQEIALHPTNPDIMLIGAVNGGVWRTLNATSANPTWTPVTDSLPSLAIGALSFDRASSSTLYAGTGKFSSLGGSGSGRAGLFTSTDGGSTWAAVAGNSTFSSGGTNISGVAANGQTILVVANTSDANSYANRGVFRSTDGGATFSHLGTSAGLSNVAVTSIVADPTNANRYYVAAHNAFNLADRGVYRTDNAGASWTKVSDATIGAVIGASTDNIQLTINNNGTLFVGVVNSGQLAGVLRTTDQGGSFSSFGVPTTTEGASLVGIHPGSQGAKHFAITADPNNDNIVVVGGDRQPIGAGGTFPNSIGANNYTERIFRSTGPGTWTPATHSDTAGNSAGHADTRALVFDLNGNLVTANDAGLNRRNTPLTSGSGNWTSIGGAGSTGLRVTELHSIAYDNHGGMLIAGSQDTGASMQTAQNSQTWQSVALGDGGVVGVFDRPGAGNSFRYYSSQYLGSFASRQFDGAGNAVGGAVYRDLTVNGGGGKALESGANAFDPNIQFYTKYAVNKVDAGRIAFGTKSLYETADHGDTLTVVGGVAGGGGPQVVFGSVVGALAYGGFKGETGHADVLYTGAGTELRIREAGAGFNVLAGVNAAYNLAAGGTGFSITDIVLDYTDWETAFVADNLSRVFLTENHGVSWLELAGLGALLGGELETLQFVTDGTYKAVFAGGLNGVFWSVSEGGVYGAWSEFGADSLPNAKVRDLDYDPTADVLVVALQGRGAWTVNNASTLLAPVPEPETWAMLLVGLGLVGAAVRRRG